MRASSASAGSWPISVPDSTSSGMTYVSSGPVPVPPPVSDNLLPVDVETDIVVNKTSNRSKLATNVNSSRMKIAIFRFGCFALKIQNEYGLKNVASIGFDKNNLNCNQIRCRRRVRHKRDVVTGRGRVLDEPAKRKEMQERRRRSV